MNKSLFAIILISISSILFSNEIFLDAKIYDLVSEEICDIKEYGIKIEYLTKKSNKEELEKYKDIFYDINSIDYDDNLINLEKEENDKLITLRVVKENNSSRVFLEIISKTHMDIEEIKKNFDEMDNENREEIKYYTYIKGDIRENKNDEEVESSLIDIFSEEGKIKVQKMVLDKGTTGIINLKSDYQFNYSIMTYEEDRVLILGSPIIFTTY
ncbi:hypothetical protein [Clostridium sp. B9]|uniref:hypothetical protein n=1 Tax=Clostridium sp. B9 TaxID=3423224 RepID=UPI003D2EAD33